MVLREFLLDPINLLRIYEYSRKSALKNLQKKTRSDTSQYTNLDSNRMTKAKLRSKKFLPVSYARINIITTCALQIRIKNRMRNVEVLSLLIKVEKMLETLNSKKLAIVIKKVIANKEFNLIISLRESFSTS